MDTTYIDKVKEICHKLGTYEETGIDDNYNIWIFVAGLEDSHDLISNGISGTGLTYAGACENYIKNLRKAKCPKYHDKPVYII
mgnify:CR=1 FL=1